MKKHIQKLETKPLMWKDIAKYDCQNDTQNIYKIVHIHTLQRAKGYK